ncbi:phage infection protein [Lacticaseibacillus sp. 866-1]|uniref:phage infection protein n=1 Tax=Lacticaseibacillus sp. 866-1 TaxID=2799576 RepID=UPI001EF297AA|nr:phage infection protein [Lacticaseibacillus sp. 866-1]
MDKDKIKVLFETDADGYITGYQQEFWDGRQWQAPFDTSKAVDLAPADVQTIVLGATKYTDGKLVLDTAKQKALADAQTQETTQPDLSAKVADLESQLQEAQAAIMELADISLGGDTDATSTTTTTSAG